MLVFSDKTYQKIYPVILITGCVAFAAPLLAYAYNGTFMRLNGDEYCYLAVQSQHGFWGMQAHSYLSVSDLYNGERYSLNFALALLGVLGPRLPSLSPSLTLLTWLLAWFFALWQVNKYWNWKLDWYEALLMIELLIFFTLIIVPDITQILYWYGGMAQYLIPIILNGFILGLIFLATRKTSKIWLVFIFILSFVCGGFSETPCFMQTIYLGIFCFIVYILNRRFYIAQYRKLFAPLILALLGSILALIALALAPSTGPRLSVSSHPSLIEAIFYSLKYGFSFIAETFLSTPVPIFVLLLLSLLLSIARRLKINNIPPISVQTFIRFALLIGIIGYLLCVATMAPSVYAQNAYPGERALLPARFISVIFIMCIGWLLGKTIHLPEKSSPSYSSISFCVLFMITVLWLYPLRAIPRITSNTSFYHKWSIFWDARHDQIIQGKEEGQKNIQVVTIDHPIMDVGELSPDPSYWYNVCASQYYGVNSIIADLPGWDK